MSSNSFRHSEEIEGQEKALERDPRPFYASFTTQRNNNLSLAPLCARTEYHFHDSLHAAKDRHGKCRLGIEQLSFKPYGTGAWINFPKSFQGGIVAIEGEKSGKT